MNKLTQMLMGNVYDRITFHPTSFESGSPGGGDDEGFDEIGNDGDDDEGEGDQGESGADDKITDDPESFMSDLFPAGDEDDDDEEEETPEQIAAAESQMAEDLKNGLSKLTLAEDLIPDDFDPNDPKQMRELLNKVQINAATNAIKLMFAPVQQTLNRMGGQMRREMRQTSRSGHDAVNERMALEESFPGIKNPVIAPVIKTIYEAAKKKHPTDRKAALAATRKGLAAVGVDGSDAGKAGSRQRDSEGGDGFRTGASALDGLGLRLPQPKRAQTGNRMRK